MAAIEVTDALDDVTDIFQTVYHPTLHEVFHTFGTKTNRVFMPSKRKSDSDEYEIKTETAKNRSVRMTRDIMAHFGDPDVIDVAAYTVNFSKSAGSNDFSRAIGTLEANHYELKRAAQAASRGDRGMIADFVERNFRSFMDQLGENVAVHRHLRQSPYLATFSGVANYTQNDDDEIANCSSYSTGQGYTEARIQVDNGPIAIFQRGQKLTIVTDDGMSDWTPYEGLEITDLNVADRSFGISGATGDLDNIRTDLNAGDTAYVFLSDEDTGTSDPTAGTKGLTSMGEWFNNGSTIYGVDRSASAGRYLNTTRVNGGGNPVARSMFDDIADSMGLVKEEGELPMVSLMALKTHTKLRQAVGEDALVPIDASGSGDLTARFGFGGLVYHHPVTGRILLEADPLAPVDKIRFVRPGDWETLYPFGTTGAFEWLPGEIGGKGGRIWYRKQHDDDSNSNGKGLVYRADGHLLMADICTNPRMQAEIYNFTTN